MAISSKSALITEIDKLIDSAELNQETQGILQNLFATVQQVDRSFNRETKFKANRGAPKSGSSKIKMPPNYAPTPEQIAEAEKKRNQSIAPPVSSEPESAPSQEPVMVETKEQPNEAELLDIIADGVDKAKETFKTPAAFSKKLKSLGIEAKGKTHEDIFEIAKLKFEEISQ